MSKNLSSKRKQTGNNRSHANNATRRDWKLNLQKVKLDNGETIRLTARELRTLKKEDKASA